MKEGSSGKMMGVKASTRTVQVGLIKFDRVFFVYGNGDSI